MQVKVAEQKLKKSTGQKKRQEELALERLLRPVQNFARLESAGGLLLMAAAVLAMIVANSAFNSVYLNALRIPFEVRFGSFGIGKPILLWINDGLMAIFFLLVGMELKREILEGHLSSLKKASLPAFAAIGGMLGPALIYWWFNSTDSLAIRGWAIPMATDIAFALGILSLLGKRVPTSLKAFLLSIAIFDDLGAIIVIALFYTNEISTQALSIAAGIVVLLAIMNRIGIQTLVVYFLLGVPLWVAVLKSGVHATIAGVVLALFIPLRTFDRSSSEPPLLRLEHALHPWVAFAILPLFAFTNAGVPLDGLVASDILRPVPLGIVLGLFLGKMAGIWSLSFVAVKLGIASLSEQISWTHLFGVAVLCGIGFTMSLFIAALAFGESGATFGGTERLGILTGSAISGIVGYFILHRTLPKTF